MSDSPAPAQVFKASPATGFLVICCSWLSTVCLLLLFPILYLMVDLLVFRGAVSLGSESPTAWPPAIAEFIPQNPSAGLLGTVSRQTQAWVHGAMLWLAGWNTASWSNENWLLQLGIAAVVLLGLRLLFLNAAAHVASSAAVEATQKLRREIYQHCFRINALAIQSEAQREAGHAITTHAEDVQEGWIVARTTVVRTLVLVLASAVILFVVQFWLGLAIFSFGGAVWLLAGQSAAWARRDARRAARRSEAQLAIMRESLRLLLMVKCYLMERFSTNRVERQLSDLAKTARRQHRGEAVSRMTLFNIAAISGVLLCYLAGRMILANTHSLAAFSVQAACSVALSVGLLRLLAARVKLRHAQGAAADIAEFLDQRTDASQDIDAKFLQPMSEKLDLIEASYREPGTGRMILEGVSLQVPAGKRTAIICSNADESRTLAHLVLRFLDPTAGEVRIDGKNTRWVTYESLRTQVATVLPEHMTFTDTVANNIGCGDSFPLPKIVEAAKLAHAHGFIQHLPYGYETIIGDGGYALRPGERFRLALARALLRDPSVLVIEEPAEPFDVDSAALIDDAVNRLGKSCTVIHLARRSTTVQRADAVYVIVDGKLANPNQASAFISGSQLYKAMAKKH